MLLIVLYYGANWSSTIRYNTQRGNHAEVRSLDHLTQFLVTTTGNNRKEADKKSPPPLPKRCLRITDAKEPWVRLVETNGSHAPYIAISHVWGYNMQMNRLTSPNLEKYKDRIDVGALPKHINDAIRFTHNMKVEYLWVDALCINHDNPSEISEELDRFVDYYSNSSMVICALQPSSAFPNLQWKSNQRLDIPPYSILRSGAPGNEDTDVAWNRAGSLKSRCFANPKSLDIDGAPKLSHINSPVVAPMSQHEPDLQVLLTALTSDATEKQTPRKSQKHAAKRSVRQINGRANMRALERLAAQEKPTNRNEVKSNAQLRQDRVWKIRLNLDIDIFLIADFAVYVYHTSRQLVRDLISTGKRNPWPVCCFVTLWFTAISFYVGFRAAASSFN
jgi:hypothetical protein